MAKPQTASLADPTRLKPLVKTDAAAGGIKGKGSKGKSKSPADQRTLQVIIETPKSSRNKYAFDPEQEIFTLRKVLPAGMAFPYDFGFLPRTIGGDGDPLDVLVLMDEPAFPGCLVPSRLIGVIEGVQIDGKKKVRNDRLVAIAQANHMYMNIRKINDLPEQFLRELENFFVNYHRLEGKEYKLLGCKDTAEALALIRKGKE